MSKWEIEGLEGLSEKEQLVVKKILELAKKKEKRITLKKSVTTPAKEYVCRFEICCKTCGKIYFESYYMEPDKGNGAYIGMMIPENKVTDCCEIRTQERDVLCCNYCVERLMKFEKEDIIKMYLKERRKWI